MERHCLTIDLRPSPELIAEYIRYHENVWPEVLQSLRDAGVIDMEIYEQDGRLMMIMETVDGFSFERKSAMDTANAKVQEWEALMAKFQEVSADKPGFEKWRRMERVFYLPKAKPPVAP